VGVGRGKRKGGEEGRGREGREDGTGLPPPPFWNPKYAIVVGTWWANSLNSDRPSTIRPILSQSGMDQWCTFSLQVKSTCSHLTTGKECASTYRPTCGILTVLSPIAAVVGLLYDRISWGIILYSIAVGEKVHLNYSLLLFSSCELLVRLPPHVNKSECWRTNMLLLNKRVWLVVTWSHYLQNTIWSLFCCHYQF